MPSVRSVQHFSIWFASTAFFSGPVPWKRPFYAGRPNYSCYMVSALPRTSQGSVLLTKIFSAEWMNRVDRGRVDKQSGELQQHRQQQVCPLRSKEGLLVSLHSATGFAQNQQWIWSDLHLSAAETPWSIQISLTTAWQTSGSAEMRTTRLHLTGEICVLHYKKKEENKEERIRDEEGNWGAIYKVENPFG